MDIEKIKNASCIYISSLEYDSFYYEKDEKQRRLDWIKKADRFSQCLSAINKGNRFDYLNCSVFYLDYARKILPLWYV